MGKDCVEISASATMLLDAYEHIKKYPSSAEDTGTIDREAIYFCQRVINTGGMELEAVQAAGVVLNIPSSGAFDNFEYYSGWEVLRLAIIAAKGHAGDIDFSNEELNDDGTSSYDRGDDDDVATNAAPEQQPGAFAEVLQTNGADSTIDLLEKFQYSRVTDREGYAKVYRTSQNENVPVSAASRCCAMAFLRL
jgi:hypothetical protein